MTISSGELVRRNAAFAASGAFAGLPFPASDTLQVLGCVDSRVDPSDVLGLKLGEGVVMRNIGGRITPATLRSWALLGRLGQGKPPRSGHLVILHLLQRLSAIGMPVLVANGDSDPMILPHYSYLLAGLIPYARVKMYPDAAHGFLFQHHAEFAADIDTFLTDAG